MFAISLGVASAGSVVVFNELQYHPANPAEPEWIELHNQMTVDVDLSGWRIRGGVDFDFPAGTVISARGYLLVSGVPASVQSAIGPWSGSLSNGGERLRLRNNSDRLMDEIDYRDSGRWPVGADGSGATLAKIAEDRGDDDASNWRASVEIGGTPGRQNFLSGPTLGAEEVIIPISGQWRYNESGADLGAGWPTASHPIDGANWFSGAGLIGFETTPASLPEPFGTTLADPRTNSVITYYFESDFDLSAEQFAGVNSLSMRHVIDDGALFHINGIEVPPRFKMAAGVVSASTTASGINNAAYQGPFALPTGSLVAGSNRISVEVHQQSPGSSDIVFGVELSMSGTIHPVVEVPLRISEISGAGDVSFRIEIANVGTAEVEAGGFVLESRGAVDGSYTVPVSTMIPAGGFLVIEEAELGFRSADGDRLFLYSPGREFLTHAASIGPLAKAYSLVHGGRFLVPDSATFGASNSVTIETDIVINEIMYHFRADPGLAGSPPVERDEEWVELFNRGTSSIDLSDWSIDGGIDFKFPAGTTIGVGDYLIVAKDAGALAAKYPGIAGVILGDFGGRLNNSRDTVRLEDTSGNPVDEVSYVEGGKWPGLADGDGSSLELRDTRADNTNPGAWAASDESDKSAWETFTYRQNGAQTYGSTRWNEMRLGMLRAGEVLVDDISVVRDPDGAAQELMQNGDFEMAAGDSKWRPIGNHRHSAVIAEPGDAGNQVIHIVASGGAGIAHNHLESTFVGNTPVQAGQIYEVSFKARWLRGDNRLNVRAFSAKLAGTFALSMPAQVGTPGAANSAAVGNLGPTIAGLRHDPIIPAAGAAVTISADIADPDGLASLVVRTTINGSPGPSTSLTPAGGGGHHEATLPGQPPGTVVQFWIEGEDSAGAVSMAPADGPESRALYQVDDGVSTSLSAQQLRLVMLPAERDFMFGFFNLMSNERLGSTVIVEGIKAHYDTGVRLRGSGAGRVRDGDHYISYNIGFPADDLFRGVHSSIGIDRSGRAPTVRGQDEIYVKHMFNHAGVPCMYDDLTFFISPRSIHNGTALLQLARYGSVFVESQFSGGDRGGVFDLDIPYGPGTTSTPGDSESVKPPMPFDSGSHTGPRWTDFANLGDDKEQYRGPFELRTGTRRDDYSGLIELCQTMDLPTGQLAAEIERVMDVDEWLRYAALNTLCGIRDTYTNPLGGLPLWHNIRVFVPEDGQAVAMPWDGDFVFGAAASSSMLTVNGNFRRILDLPQYTRLYWGHIRDLVTSTFNTAYMDPWLEHYGDVCGQNFTARSSYIAARGAYALTQLPANVGFAVTTTGGFDFAVDDTMATLEGDGWIDIREFRLAGSHDPLEAIWTDGGSWQVQIPLLPGANPITLETYDFQGLLLDSHSLTITSTVTAPTTPEFLRITELHYNPADPSGVELAVSVDNDDYEFVELRNIGPDPLDISGAKFTAGITFTFAPGTILQGGEFILVVSDQAAFEARYGNSLNVAGEYAPTNLANSGETLELRDAPGNIVHQFSYDDDWLPASDGHGYSMGILDQDAASAQWGLREGWGLCGFGGSPGAVDACHGTQFEAWQQTYFTEAEREDLSVSAPGSDPNHDGTDNLSSYAFALDPFSVPGSGKPVAVALVGGRLQITFKRWRFAPDLIYTPQFSSDLKNWAGGMTQVGGPLDNGDGTESVTFEVPGESHTTIFVRVVLELTSLP